MSLIGGSRIIMRAIIMYFQETSVLRSKLAEHGNLVRYAERIKTNFVDTGPSYSVPYFHVEPSSSTSRKGPTRSKIL